MRIRRKAWTQPELEACPFYIDQPQQNKRKVAPSI